MTRPHLPHQPATATTPARTAADHATRLGAALLLALAAGTSHAHGDVKCPASPKAEWRPHAELERKLTAEGWVVRRMEATATCYEVYAKDPQGKRIEAFFNPKTLERVQ